MISPLSRLASSIASRLFPAPVGPDITITFSFFAPEAEQEVDNTRRQRLSRNEAARRRGLSDEYGRRRQHARRPHAPLSILVCGERFHSGLLFQCLGLLVCLCCHFFQRFWRGFRCLCMDIPYPVFGCVDKVWRPWTIILFLFIFFFFEEKWIDYWFLLFYDFLYLKNSHGPKINIDITNLNHLISKKSSYWHSNSRLLRMKMNYTIEVISLQLGMRKGIVMS